MKNTMKRVLFVFAVVLAVACFNVNAEAKTKTKKTSMFVGEKTTFTYSGIGTVKSVKVGNKKIATAKKSGNKCVITAKKKGKTTVTIKGSKCTYKHVISVAVQKLDVKFKQVGDENAIITLTNNTLKYYNWFRVNVVFRDARGNEVYKTSTYINNMCPRQSGSDVLYFGPDAKNVDISKTTYQIQSKSIPGAKYKNYAKNVEITEYKRTAPSEEVFLDMTASTSYSGKGDISITYEVDYMDGLGNVVYIENRSDSLSSYKQKSEISIPYNVKYGQYVVKKRVLLKE